MLTYPLDIALKGVPLEIGDDPATAEILFTEARAIQVNICGRTGLFERELEIVLEGDQVFVKIHDRKVPDRLTDYIPIAYLGPREE